MARPTRTIDHRAISDLLRILSERSLGAHIEHTYDYYADGWLLKHVPSGFWMLLDAAEPDPVLTFGRHLLARLNRDVDDALTLYQEPHLVRL